MLSGGRPPSFEVKCAGCGAMVHVTEAALIQRPIEVLGLKDVRETGMDCGACGTFWRMGYTSGRLEEIAGRISRARYEPRRLRNLKREFVREERLLQAQVLVLTRGRGRPI